MVQNTLLPPSECQAGRAALLDMLQCISVLPPTFRSDERRFRISQVFNGNPHLLPHTIGGLPLNFTECAWAPDSQTKTSGPEQPSAMKKIDPNCQKCKSSERISIHQTQSGLFPFKLFPLSAPTSQDRELAFRDSLANLHRSFLHFYALLLYLKMVPPQYPVEIL